VIRKWWNGNSTRIWRLIVILLLSIIGFFGTGVFADYKHIRNTYVSQQELIEVKKDLREDIHRIEEGITALRTEQRSDMKELRDSITNVTNILIKQKK